MTDLAKKKRIEQFEKIQKRIGRQYVYVSASHCGTINPDETRTSEAEGYVKIMADRFGPFSPEIFFEQGTRRIVYLVKEPYHSGSIVNGYSGTDKVKDFGHLGWKELGGDKVKLYQNIAQSAFEIIIGRPMNRNSTEEQELAVKCLREHCCIINCNFFPNIAQPEHKGKASSTKLISKWAQINKATICELIDICSPEIIIGGATLTNFCDVTGQDEGTLFNDKVCIINTDKLHREMGKKNGIIYKSDRCIYINAHHPSFPRFRPQIPIIARIIDDWDKGDLSYWEM